ncbi:MAG: hypothetical protein HFF14_01535 [Angelakisella sp.]|jgi:hypothetical protein|nr:hypothetical protein [Angelakisella sp.]
MPAQPSNNMPEVMLPISQMGEITAEVDTKSLQETLCDAMGRFVVCKFLIGTGETVSVKGYLRSVGSSFFVLLDPCTNAETTCDLYSLKFITAYPEGVPECQMYCNQRLYDL